MTEERKKVKIATFNVTGKRNITFTFETFMNFYIAVTAKCPDKLIMSRYKQPYDILTSVWVLHTSNTVQDLLFYVFACFARF